MIDDLDEALRLLLIRELPVKNGEVDIQFHQPRREWSARLSRPTLNLFLYDLKENVKLRPASPAWRVEQRGDHTVTLRQRPVRVELRYVLTAWANEPADEHRLLARAVMALFRFPELPVDVLPESLQGQPAPITVEVAQPDGLVNPSDFWSAMDNEMRPAIMCCISMALDPNKPFTTPLVTGRQLRFVDADTGRVETPGVVLWGVSGKLLGLPPLRPAQMTLVERALNIPVERDGTFILRGIPEGEYTLEVSVVNGPSAHLKLVVPARNYELEFPKEEADKPKPESVDGQAETPSCQD
jgi:hypothetical protein